MDFFIIKFGIDKEKRLFRSEKVVLQEHDILYRFKTGRLRNRQSLEYGFGAMLS